jgi:protease-4
MASIEEQRRARRWGIFFKSLLVIYLGVATWMTLKPMMSASDSDGRDHTAVIDVAGSSPRVSPRARTILSRDCGMQWMTSTPRASSCA